MKKIFYIAEIGINHNGDINICKNLINLAKEAGCDAVKFQKRDIDLVYSKEILDSLRESPWGTTQRDQKKGLEFGQKEYEIIDSYCKEKKIEWFSSAWDLNSQNFLKQFNSKFNKIASAMIVDLEFLKLVANEKKHTFISTGMSTIENIDNAVKIFREADCPFELMHCVSTYPLDFKKANLNVIKTLKKKYKCNIGYSGHESGLAVSYAASSLGISSLERHITLDRTMYGSDQAASLEPNGLKNLITTINKMIVSYGDGIKTFDDAEQKVAKKLRAHLKL